MALSPHAADPNRDEQLAARRENPGAWNVRPGHNVEREAARMGLTVEQYYERMHGTSREAFDKTYRDKRPDRAAKKEKK